MKKRIIGLDILRVIGVLFIFCYHFTVDYIYRGNGTSQAMMDLNYFFNVMARPASLFLFIISGYALMYNREDSITLKQYYFKRFKGLFVPFYVAYTLMTCLYFYWNNGITASFVKPWKFIYTILGIDGMLFQTEANFYLVGEWFMSCIVICYVFFPLLAWLLKKAKFVTLIVLLVVSNLMLFVYNPFEINVLMNPIFIMVYFYIGMLMHETIGDKTIPNYVKWICLVITILIWGHYLIQGYAPQDALFMLTAEAGEIAFAIWSLAMIIGLRDVTLKEGRLYQAVAYISKISWCVILVHHALMGLFFSTRDVSGYTGKELFVAFIMFVLLSWAGAELVIKLSAKVNGFLFPKKADAK